MSNQKRRGFKDSAAAVVIAEKKIETPAVTEGKFCLLDKEQHIEFTGIKTILTESGITSGQALVTLENTGILPSNPSVPKVSGNEVQTGMKAIGDAATAQITEEKRQAELLKLDALETECVLAVQGLTGKSFMIDATIGEYLYRVQKAVFRTLGKKDANKRWRLFLSTCGIKDKRTADAKIGKHLILRRIPSQYHRKLASFLAYKTLGILDAASACKRGHVFGMLAKKFDTIQSSDPAIISDILDAWVRRILNIDKPDQGTPPADQGTPPADQGTPPADQGTREDGKFKAISLDTLGSELGNPNARADMLCKHVDALVQTLERLRSLDKAELLEYVALADAERVRTRLSMLNVASVALSSRLANFVRTKKVA